MGETKPPGCNRGVLRMANCPSDGSSAGAGFGKVFGAPEMGSLVDSALDFWLTTGRFNDAFEARLAQASELHALTVNSGSSANLLAFPP